MDSEDMVRKVNGLVVGEQQKPVLGLYFSHEEKKE